MILTPFSYLAFIFLFDSVFIAHRWILCAGEPVGPKKRKILILDVDNTLYKEKELQILNKGIEQQIIDNTHSFCQRLFHLSKKQCDDLYLKYGSTIEGLRYLISEGKLELKSEANAAAADDTSLLDSVMVKYYHDVYNNIDMTGLMLSTDPKEVQKTGYNHATLKSKRIILQTLLKHSPYPIYFASNSPLSHVRKVLRNLGLNDVPYFNIITPDSTRLQLQSKLKLPYPTKFHPMEFYSDILKEHNAQNCDFYLIDDSLKNIESASKLGFKGILVHNDNDDSNTNHRTLEQALAVAFGHMESAENYLWHEDDYDTTYAFSDVKYLSSKNVVDREAMDTEVWNNMMLKLVEISKDVNSSSTKVRIVDIGAGLLLILDMLMFGHKGKESLLTIMRHEGISFMEYTAYESNKNLIPSCFTKLRDLGFQRVSSGNDDSADQLSGMYIFEKTAEISIRVTLKVKDFSHDVLGESERPHLIVGCCFADLFDPDVLVSSILHFTGDVSYGGGTSNYSSKEVMKDILLYFPITFSGTTQFVPPQPFQFFSNSNPAPSDTLAFQLYASSLAHQHGHNLDPDKLISSMKETGIDLIESAPSIWNIESEKHNYLWRTMLYFFGTSAGPELLKHNWNSYEWLNRARKFLPKIRVINKDLLFRITSIYDSRKVDTHQNLNPKREQKTMIEEIEFRSPNNVGKSITERPIDDPGHLKPNQVEIKSMYSLISSGTELKIFKGAFDEAALDVNIKGMEDQSMKYPLSYGYSMVGVVIRCGENVKDPQDLLGKIVFSFSPHASHVIVDRESIHIVPDGISPQDAIFMPSVETALSIVHDAHVRLGENVAIYGQGLIGLLVNAILSKYNCHQDQSSSSSSPSFGRVTVFDTLPDRLATASIMGATQALLPSESEAAGPFDVSIEVSGNSKALQSAIDHTRDGGRIVIGSWYGNSNIDLKLGIDFHRSHKTIKTSQVSTIPAELSLLWDKQRRFDLSWELVRSLKPSRLISKILTLDKAQDAYEALDKGQEIAIAFEYK